MTPSATVVVLMPLAREAAWVDAAPGLSLFSQLRSTLDKVALSQLGMVLVAPSSVLQQASAWMPAHCTPCPSDAQGERQSLAQSVAAAVLASAQASGWLLLPGEMPMLQTSTLHQVAQAIQTHPVAYPTFQARRGHPTGFGKELFSELIHLGHDRDLHRLASRYPAAGIDVGDPASVMQPLLTPDEDSFRSTWLDATRTQRL